MNDIELMDVVLDAPIEEKIIKVVGVGGGGGNAVSYMYNQGDFEGVSFLLLNTDKQVLNRSKIPNKLILGGDKTRGRGAGNKPEVAREATLDSEAEIREALLEDGTEMVFITATMGGGTGTGAAPIVGRIARELKLLTVGVVSVPFRMEGEDKVIKALKGVEELRKNVDVLLVLNNDKLLDIYQDLRFKEALKKSDETLCSAVRGISNLIVKAGDMNVDFADVRTTLENGGVAIINTGYASGEDRVNQAVMQALNSPLLNNNNLEDATRILVSVYDTPQNRLGTKEFEYLKALFQRLNNNYDAIIGYFSLDDDSLGEHDLAVTILASGFDYKNTRSSIQGMLPASYQVRANSVIDDEAKRRESEYWDETIKQIYGETQSFQRDINPVCLSICELDDDDILQELENIPAIKRNHKQIDQLRATRQPQYSPVVSSQIEERDKPEEAIPTARVGETITFG